MAQRFYNLVLLPRVRDDIAEYKRLNFHLYMALKKALFKPGAWFKGDSLGWGTGKAEPPVDLGLAVRVGWVRVLGPGATSRLLSLTPIQGS